MMDPSIGWLQNETKGPAQELWLKLWKDFNTNGKISIDGEDNSSSIVSQLCDCFPQLKHNPSSTYDLENNQHLIRRHKGIPWRKSKDSCYEGIEGLHQEIEEFYEYMKPKSPEYSIRIEVQTRITKVIEDLWKDAVVECFGSFKTNTYLPTSDIDLVVINHRWPYLPLIELEQHFINSCQCLPTHIRVLDRASVPIIKMIDLYTGIRINISFNMPQVVKSVNLVNEYLKEYPNVTKLLFVIKQFVLQRDLNEVFRGGLSSYSLVLMVVHFFKINPDTQVKPEESNLGNLLMRFLDLYGRRINYEKVGLKVKDGVFAKKSDLFANMENGHDSRNQPSFLCIEDPLDQKNNVSKNSYNAHKVKDAFSYAYEILNGAVGPNKLTVGKTDTILGRIVRITDEVIDKREILLYYHRNFHLEPPFGRNINPYKNRGNNFNKRGKKGGQRNPNTHWNHQNRNNPNQRPNNHLQQQNVFPSAETSQQSNGITVQKFQNNGRNNGRNWNNYKRFDHMNGQMGHYNNGHHYQPKFNNQYNNISYYSFDRNPNHYTGRALQEHQINTQANGDKDPKPEVKGSTDISLDTSADQRRRSNTCD